MSRVPTENIEQEVERYMALGYAIEIVQDECGGSPCFLASNPELPGCMAQGATRWEAVNNLADARRDYIRALLDAGLEVPAGVSTTISVYKPHQAQSRSTIRYFNLATLPPNLHYGLTT